MAPRVDGVRTGPTAWDPSQSRPWPAVPARSRSLAQHRCTQGLGDTIDCGAPAGFRAGHGYAEGIQGLGRRATVAEDAGTDLPGIAHGLMPLHGIDVLGGHVFAPRGFCFLVLGSRFSSTP